MPADETVRQVHRWRTDGANNSHASVALSKNSGRVTAKLVWVSSQQQAMADDEWSACTVQNCFGSEINSSGVCLVHADPALRIGYLAVSASPEQQIDVRGTRLTEALWHDIMSTAITRLSVIQAGAVEFPFTVNLRDIEFPAAISLVACRFEMPVHLDNVKFHREVDLRSADFSQSCALFSCTVGDQLMLDGSASHENEVVFSGTIGGPMTARGADLSLRLEDADIHGDCDLTDFAGDKLTIRTTRFRRGLNLTGIETKWVIAAGVETSSNHIGPLRAEHMIDFTDATFARRVRLQVETASLNLARANFTHGGTIEVHGARVALDGVIVSDDLHVRGDSGAAIERVQGADLARTTLAGVEMRTCELYGAPGLSSLTIDSTVDFFRTTGWRLRRPCIVAWRTRRDCVYDEVVWRSKRRGPWRRYWMKGVRPTVVEEGQEPPPEPATRTPRQIETVYRSLREGLEGRSDYAGAAAFYYGEMEMRRLDKNRSRLERFVVWLYWAMSGYGLRASRSLLLLLTTLAAGALLFHGPGMRAARPTWGAAILSAAQSLVPGLPVTRPMTTTGGMTDVVLTILGPLLIGLAALAVRGRVRR